MTSLPAVTSYTPGMAVGTTAPTDTLPWVFCSTAALMRANTAAGVSTTACACAFDGQLTTTARTTRVRAHAAGRRQPRGQFRWVELGNFIGPPGVVVFGAKPGSRMAFPPARCCRTVGSSAHDARRVSTFLGWRRCQQSE